MFLPNNLPTISTSVIFLFFCVFLLFIYQGFIELLLCAGKHQKDSRYTEMKKTPISQGACGQMGETEEQTNNSRANVSSPWQGVYLSLILHFTKVPSTQEAQNSGMKLRKPWKVMWTGFLRIAGIGFYEIWDVCDGYNSTFWSHEKSVWSKFSEERGQKKAGQRDCRQISPPYPSHSGHFLHKICPASSIIVQSPACVGSRSLSL